MFKCYASDALVEPTYFCLPGHAPPTTIQGGGVCSKITISCSFCRKIQDSSETKKNRAQTAECLNVFIRRLTSSQILEFALMLKHRKFLFRLNLLFLIDITESLCLYQNELTRIFASNFERSTSLLH